MSANNTTNHSEDCDSARSIAVAGFCVFGIGVASNVLLLYFIVEKIAKGKRNDKLFLLNIIIANFLSLFGSLLGELLSRGNIFPNSAQKFCVYFHQINFLSLFGNITSMAALCYDRFEKVALFPAQRKLSFSKSIRLVVIGWALPLVLIPSAGSGFVVSDIQGKSICKVQREKAATTSEIVSFAALIILVTLWITVGAHVIKLSFKAIYSKLKEHRLETENVLGKSKTVKEVNLQRQAVTMIVCYSMCWIPFGIVAGLTAFNKVNFHSCYYFGCQIAAHGSAATTPLVYLTIDKRFRLKFRSNEDKYRTRNSPTVSP